MGVPAADEGNFIGRQLDLLHVARQGKGRSGKNIVGPQYQVVSAGDVPHQPHHLRGYGHIVVVKQRQVVRRLIPLQVNRVPLVAAVAVVAAGRLAGQVAAAVDQRYLSLGWRSKSPVSVSLAVVMVVSRVRPREKARYPGGMLAPKPWAGDAAPGERPALPPRTTGGRSYRGTGPAPPGPWPAWPSESPVGSPHSPNPGRQFPVLDRHRRQAAEPARVGLNYLGQMLVEPTGPGGRTSHGQGIPLNIQQEARICKPRPCPFGRLGGAIWTWGTARRPEVAVGKSNLSS